MKKVDLAPAVLWFTGLSGAGKTTLATTLFQQLQAGNIDVEHLDGDTIRKFFPFTGFSKKERDEHVKRVGFLASRLEAHGVFTLVSLISPYRESRDFVRKLCKNFIEVYVSTPLEICEKRDPKGLYAKARKGELQNFTGIDDPYEPPPNAELTIDTRVISAAQAVDDIVTFLKHRIQCVG